jgi:hypothetical protein
MSARAWFVLLTAVTTGSSAAAQNSVTDLNRPGQHAKFLTHNQNDRWLLEGEAGETLIAHVASREFDPILELVRDGVEKPLLEVDDPGSESRYAVRLPEKGKYEIRVHADKFQGGGNYTLQVERFRASPVKVGESVSGTFDRDGKGYHFFPGVKDRVLVPEVKGTAAEAWRALDYKGRDVRGWAETIPIEQDGEGYVIVAGRAGQRYDLVLREARRQDLVEGREQSGKLGAGEMDVWSFTGKPGEFRTWEVVKKGDVQVQVVYAPPDRAAVARLGGPADRPEIEFIPVAGRGGKVRFAAVLGREGRYQVHVRADSPASYTLTAKDPSIEISAGKDAAGDLSVGGTAFYRFTAKSGQLVQATLTSQKFVPVLRLYDGHGRLVADNSIDADTAIGRVTHMVLSDGTYRLQVGSAGDGGGGEYRLALADVPVAALAVDGRAKATLPAGGTDFWSFEGKEGQTVFLSVRSAAFEPAVSVRGPTGVVLVAEAKADPATGSLTALKLPKVGRYTVWVTTRKGAGDYTIRLIDGD